MNIGITPQSVLGDGNGSDEPTTAESPTILRPDSDSGDEERDLIDLPSSIDQKVVDADATEEAGILRLIADQWAGCINDGVDSGGGPRMSPMSTMNHRISQRFAKYGLQQLFEQLSDVCPVPTDNNWYREVFANYDTRRTGFIGRTEFEDIVLQYYRFHRENNRKKNRIHGNNTAKLAVSNDTDNGTRQFKSQVLYPIHRGSKKIWQDYTFHNVTGKGSFGTVDIVIKKSTGKKRACKTIVISSREHGSLVQMEIDLIKRLNHPNILRLVETYTNGYVVNIITEYCAGGQLFERLAPGKAVTEGMVSQWFRQITSALSYLHKLGIAHRDIKPENLLFLDTSENSSIKLIDFGLSSTMDHILATRHEVVEKRSMGISRILGRFGISDKFLKSSGKTRKRIIMQRAGTPHYMAPEMIKGEYDQECDMFSMGVILFQCLTGTHPFFTPGVDTEQNVRDKILYYEPKCNGPLWNGVSFAARDLCQRMLAKNPKKRISSTDAMEHRWIKPSTPAPGRQSLLTASILDNLKDWKNMSSLKQAVLHMVASRLSETEIADLRRHFEKIDTKQSGSVCLADLRKACLEAGLTDKCADIDESLNAIVESLDYTGQGLNIGYNEFISALLTKRKSIEDKELIDIFQQFDVEAKGYLTTKELQNLLKSNSSKESMVSRLESANEQKVTLSEFMDLVRG
eukprot:GHVH01004547.1.p1 GENE.GHVH01004547.1~~GHVH01004547.1.p1  ORF type:complete len:686 (+),score=76.45 GHVH01004547.1:47-2104(+)